jgi:radical SAM superfamily enzyme YgiQ (UPF0313 family)
VIVSGDEMKILLIMPDAHMHKLRIGSWVRSMREMPLSICTLAALTPNDPDISIELVDGSVDRIPWEAKPDLVGISVLTGCANQAYEIADHFRDKGAKVILGGVHVTILPEEGAQHADSIVIGQAEITWPQLIRDFRKGKLKKTYREVIQDGDFLEGVPSPLRELHNRRRYMIPDTVQATRGCRRACDFCTVPAVFPKFLKRPIADVIDDIRRTKSRYIAFNDVSIAEDPDYAKELFRAMIPLRKKWGGLATVEVARDEELLTLIKKSGCIFLLYGFESIDQSTLHKMGKGFNLASQYEELMYRMHMLDISVQGCFVFGFDHDDKDVFQKTVERVHELKVDIPRYSIHTPYPGTQLFHKLSSEGRILSYNWNDYDTMHVVSQPAQMSPEELFRGFKWAYHETFKTSRILQRMQGVSTRTAVNFVGNLAYKMFVKRLYSEPRFKHAYSLAPSGSKSPLKNLNTCDLDGGQLCRN